jgi:hypothetical protein
MVHAKAQQTAARTIDLADKSCNTRLQLAMITDQLAGRIRAARSTPEPATQSYATSLADFVAKKRARHVCGLLVAACNGLRRLVLRISTLVRGQNFGGRRSAGV